MLNGTTLAGKLANKLLDKDRFQLCARAGELLV